MEQHLNEKICTKYSQGLYKEQFKSMQKIQKHVNSVLYFAWLYFTLHYIILLYSFTSCKIEMRRNALEWRPKMGLLYQPLGDK
jgi:hypothetical protein